MNLWTRCVLLYKNMHCTSTSCLPVINKTKVDLKCCKPGLRILFSGDCNTAVSFVYSPWHSPYIWGHLLAVTSAKACRSRVSTICCAMIAASIKCLWRCKVCLREKTNTVQPYVDLQIRKLVTRIETGKQIIYSAQIRLINSVFYLIDGYLCKKIKVR